MAERKKRVFLTMKDYNADVMAESCPHCGAGPRERCKPGPGAIVHKVAPHGTRVKKAEETKERNERAELASRAPLDPPVCLD